MARLRKQKSDYDSPWKEILEIFFSDFMAFFFPQAHAEIDWTRGYTFLDKELQQVVRTAQTGSRRVDKLVQLYLLDGVETWLLIHIEVQGQKETGFAERMYVYHYRLFDKYKQQVVSLAVLTDDDPTWKPASYGYARWGCKVSLDFPIIKLLDYEPKLNTLWQSSNPFAVVVLAHLQTLQTRRKPAERYQAKFNLIRMLYRRGWSQQDIYELLRFIDWVMTLPEGLEQQLQTEIDRFEEEVKMRYVPTFERKAMHQGELQAAREFVVEALDTHFKLVPESVTHLLKQIEDIEVLREFLRLAITAESLAAFEQKLREAIHPEPA